MKSGNAVGDGQKETDGLVTVVRLKMWSIKPWGVPQERLSCKIPRIGGEREREREMVPTLATDQIKPVQNADANCQIWGLAWLAWYHLVLCGVWFQLFSRCIT